MRGKSLASSTRIQDIRKYDASINLFSMIFEVNVETFPAEFRMEMIYVHMFDSLTLINSIYLLMHFHCLLTMYGE